MNYEHWRAVLKDERLPAVVVDVAAFDRNVALIAEIVRRGGHGHHLRLATKSVRVPALIRRILDSREVYRGLMCYAVEEVCFLAEHGFDDFLVAYPTVQPSDCARLVELKAAGKTVRLVLDSIEQIEMVSDANSDHQQPLDVVLDVDMSLRMLGGRLHLGVRRSPLRSVKEVFALCEGATRHPGVRIVGLMGYEAQVAGLGDRNPFKRMINPVAGAIRNRSKQRIAELRQQLAEGFEHRGLELQLFNGGGTGSVNFAVREPWLTELTAGSGFLCSHLFDYFSNIHPEPACFFALQATRSSDDGYLTCAGGGYIASGEPGWDKVPRPHLPKGLQLVSTEGCGEVQTPLRMPNNGSLELGRQIHLGDPVLFRHAKAGELAEHFNEYLLVKNEKIVERAETYRGLGRSFL